MHGAPLTRQARDAVRQRSIGVVRLGYPAPVAVVTFADGQEIRMSFWSQKGRSLDWDRAVRVCTSGYRCLNRPRPDGPRRGWELLRLPLSAVPPIVRVYEATTGETYIPGTVPGQDRREAA